MKFIPITAVRQDEDYITYEEVRPYCLSERKWLRKTGVEVGSKVVVISPHMHEPIDNTAVMREPPDHLVGKVVEVTRVFARTDMTLPFAIAILGDGSQEYEDEYIVPFYCLVPIGD